MERQGQGEALRCQPCPCGHLPYRGGTRCNGQGSIRHEAERQPLLLEGHRYKCYKYYINKFNYCINNTIITSTSIICKRKKEILNDMVNDYL